MGEPKGVPRGSPYGTRNHPQVQLSLKNKNVIHVKVLILQRKLHFRPTPELAAPPRKSYIWETIRCDFLCGNRIVNPKQ